MATTYNVYRDGVKIKSGLTTTTFTDTGLTAGKEYAYQVSSVNEVGESPLSEKAFVTIRSVTLDVNGTVKTGTFAEKTLDEDAYDDLAVKDSNTVYKVYPENGNPDEAAWFLGEQPVDSAKEGDTVVYGRNYYQISLLTPLCPMGPEGEVSYGGGVGFHSISIYVQKDVVYSFWRGNVMGDRLRITLSKEEPRVGVSVFADKQYSELGNFDGYTVSETAWMTLTLAASQNDGVKKNQKATWTKTGKHTTIYTVAPEDVAIFTESTGGGAA